MDKELFRKQARERVRTLMDRIDRSPCCYQAAENECAILEKNGFKPLDMTERWTLNPGDARYVLIGDTCVVAFRVGETPAAGFHIIGAHNDSPGFQIKANADVKKEGVHQLNVEPYGGLIYRTWLDRPLSVCGRVILKAEDGSLERRNVVVDRDWLIIPSLAIHMGRDVNDEGKINPQKEMIPFFALGHDGDKDFLTRLAEELGVEREQILGTDLFLYSREKGTFVGDDEALFSIGRIDDLACAYAAVDALTETTAGPNHRLIVINDHEEVGSGTRKGANSAQLMNLLERIVLASGGDRQDYLRSLDASFLISCDQAHAVHPNYPEVADPTNRPRLNGGPVIKIAANRSYNTDGAGEALFRSLADKAGVPVQTFHNRSDRRGGSTIGPITERWTTIPGADVGNPMLSMHSVRELAGVEDHESMVRILKAFFGEN